jgi:hypothetical protein
VGIQGPLSHRGNAGPEDDLIGQNGDHLTAGQGRGFGAPEDREFMKDARHRVDPAKKPLKPRKGECNRSPEVTLP